MPRPPRLLLSKSYYHIMTRGNNRNVVFKDDEDYQYFLSSVLKYKEILPFDIYHYCLMPNHTHFLIQTKNAKDFSNFMKKLNLSYFQYFNKKYTWVGHFWQGRFKSQPVGKDAYFIQCGKYIELNPRRAELVENIENYRYSSYRHYTNGLFDPLVTDDFLYEDLGLEITIRQKEYKKLIMDDTVIENYKNNTWGSSAQRYNEHRKIHYHTNN